MTDQTNPTSEPHIVRVRHELTTRRLEVRRVERITPIMIRVTFGGADLAGLETASPDDHVKLCLPGKDGAIAKREYTIRSHDPDAGTIAIDFVDHDAGPAADWARGASPGTTLDVMGPRGSQIVSGDIRRWLLIGDETALPAIARRIGELGPGIAAETLIAVPGPADEQLFAGDAEIEAHWLHRPISEADDPAPFLSALRGFDLSAVDFVWIGAEGMVARAIRRHLIEDRSVPKTRIKSAGYWLRGRADASDKTLDSE